jgi:glycosyltransferase involved in cell wall biosynthesis
MPNNILYVTPALPVGGAEKFLVLLANSLVMETGHQTVVSLSSINKLQHELDHTIQFLPLPRSGRFDFYSVKSLRKFIIRDKPDIIFCINFFSYFFMRLSIFGLGLEIPVFISYHSTIHENKKEHFLHKFYSLLLNKRDHIITVSKNQALYTSRVYHIPDYFFKTIHNGIDILKWHLPGNNRIISEIRGRYRIPENDSVIIMTAAFRPEKNHLGAVKSLKLLHTIYNIKAYLLFVGEGPLFEQCRQFAEDMNINEYIRFIGPQKDVLPFYWASNIFALCSKSVETFSIAALEAMACGLPCVLTNIGGADEMIKEGFNGFLCKPEEQDIARSWFKALNFNFSAQDIHNFTEHNFSAALMVKKYKETLFESFHYKDVPDNHEYRYE